MDDCLITKLKSVVNDDTLYKIGEIKGLVNFSLMKSIAIGCRGKGSTMNWTNCTVYNINGQGVEQPLPFTSTYDGEYLFKPLTYSEETGIFTLNNKYVCKELNLNSMKLYNSIEDTVGGIEEKLTKLSFYQTDIHGDLHTLCKLPNLAVIYLGYTTGNIENNNIRLLISKFAETRKSGTLDFACPKTAPGDLVDIPAFFDGSYYGRSAIIYFDPNYPMGWYGKSVNGRYYNAYDEEITI